MEYCLSHIGTVSLLFGVFTGQEQICAASENGRKPPQNRNIRAALSGFPFGYGLIADVQDFGELELCQGLLCPQTADERPGF